MRLTCPAVIALRRKNLSKLSFAASRPRDAAAYTFWKGPAQAGRQQGLQTRAARVNTEPKRACGEQPRAFKTASDECCAHPMLHADLRGVDTGSPVHPPAPL